MSTRMVTDCNRCGKENIEESFRLEIIVAGEKKRVDLDTKCLGETLQELVRNMNPVESRELYDRMDNTVGPKSKKPKSDKVPSNYQASAESGA